MENPSREPVKHLRPVLVTDEKLRANLVKLEKQKLFREALDQQVREAKRLKAGEDRHSFKSVGKRPINVSPPSLPQDNRELSLRSPPFVSSPAGPMPVRYKFSFEDGKAQFSKEPSFPIDPELPQVFLHPGDKHAGAAQRHSHQLLGDSVGVPKAGVSNHSFGHTPQSKSSPNIAVETSSPYYDIAAFAHPDPLYFSAPIVDLEALEGRFGDDGTKRPRGTSLGTSGEIISPNDPFFSSPTGLRASSLLLGDAGGLSSRHEKSGAMKRQSVRNLPPLDPEGDSPEIPKGRRQTASVAEKGRRTTKANVVFKGGDPPPRKGPAKKPPTKKKQPPVGSPLNEEVERLGKKLEENEAVVDMLKQKEKSWEEQVNRLKIALMKAQKSSKREVNDDRGVVKRRAETAPEAEIEVGARPDPSLFPNRARYGHCGRRAPLTQENPQFTRARVFSSESFRRVESPLLQMGELDQHWLSDGEHDPDYSVESPQAPDPRNGNRGSYAGKGGYLTPGREGCYEGQALPEASTSVPISYEHLIQFSDAQIITQQQASSLWMFFVSAKQEKCKDPHVPFPETHSDLSVTVEEVGIFEDSIDGSGTTPNARGGLLESYSTFDMSKHGGPIIVEEEKDDHEGDDASSESSDDGSSRDSSPISDMDELLAPHERAATNLGREKDSRDGGLRSAQSNQTNSLSPSDYSSSSSSS